MVALGVVKAHNAALSSMTSSLVAVFVGGTSGISLATALALARHTSAPKIYLIGRSQSAADAAIASIHRLNPSAQSEFLQADISLLKNVDKVCAEIVAKENKLNLLFMTPGYVTLRGRDETAEGLDRKFVLHYYARMRFVTNLLPLLTSGAASKDTSAETNTTGSLSRVVSVLDPMVAVRAGASGTLDMSDLSLKHHFSLKNCGAHAGLMMNFFLEDLARQHPETSFIHAYPSGVNTGVLREMPFSRVLSAIFPIFLRPFMVPIEESGERHLFAATSERYPPRSYREHFQQVGNNNKIENNDKEGDIDVAEGSDGSRGSGCYWLNWNGDPFATSHKIDAVRAQQGTVETVVQHTYEVFQRVCEQGQTYP